GSRPESSGTGGGPAKRSPSRPCRAGAAGDTCRPALRAGWRTPLPLRLEPESKGVKGSTRARERRETVCRYRTSRPPTEPLRSDGCSPSAPNRLALFAERYLPFRAVDAHVEVIVVR